MGGTKNRDAKRAVNKVFSSGGGGGTKGPAVVDKRNQELTCPHCDRIFKQSGRLVDHIKKQHSDTEEAGDGEAAQPEVRNSSSAAASSSVAAGPAMPAAAKPAAAPAAAAAPLPPKPAVRMMDVGSKGGAYDYKSPKLLLQEWLFKEKQPKARYKALPGPAGGSWLCKVVLPHPKVAEKDVVIFLPEAHAAATEDEAQQRGAVAALHRIAGDRALERTLPPQYAPLWRALVAAAAERRQKDAAAAERRATQQAKQAATLKKRGPATVIMTEDKRKIVSDIIAEVRGSSGSGIGETAGEGGSGGAAGADDGWESFGRPDAAAAESLRAVEAAPALVEDLAVLGFERGDAERAVIAVAGRDRSGAAALSAALDWLCLNVSEVRLPSNFAPGAAGKPISVLLKAGRASSTSLASAASEPAAAGGPLTALEDDPAVLEVTRYGYPPALAAEALQQCQGHVQRAVAWLYRLLSTSSSSIPRRGEGEEASEGATADLLLLSKDSATSAAALEEWLEERLALEAIYGEDVAFPSDSWTTIQITAVLSGEAAEAAAARCGRPKEALMMDGLTLELEAWASSCSTSSRSSSTSFYPTVPPILAIRAPDLPPRCLLALTRSLAEAAAAAAGRPMLYELACHAVEALPECLLRPPTLGELLGGGKADEAAVSEAEEAAATAAAEAADQKTAAAAAGRRGRQSRRGDGERRRHPTLNVAAESSRLMTRQKELEGSSSHAAMGLQRSRLPAAAQRGEVVAALGSATRVCVVSGATGCGKSTQVPQYVLEEAIAGGRGAECNIIVTQPRRISAVGLASRVAAERGESVGETVGYSVRLDSKQSARTRLLFCTTGILLRRLLSDPALSGTTHVVLDEVHERSIESDLLLLLLRKLLVSGANPGLRVVLMSATADAQLFASYFDSVLPCRSTILTIPGFTHPVTDLFLEDALEETGMLIGKSSKWAKKETSSGVKKKGGKGGDEDEEGFAEGADCRYSSETLQSLRSVDESLVNVDLIEALVARVAAKTFAANAAERGAGGKGGGGDANAILVFAPGADEIGRVVRAIEGSARIAAAAPKGVRALPLHGGLPPSQQSRVFDRPPAGVLKVVVATNVAETSITIDDVVCVIDSGRVKEMRFDPGRGIARLQETWVSQASAQQRRGRAGRVRPGVCYRLFSRKSWRKMPVDTAPEVARAPLQSLIMDVKGILRDTDAAQALAQMITPPVAGAVAQAVEALQRVGALDPGSGALTPLGHHLTRMPCDPRVGKMLIFGAMLRCLDPILTVAAAQGHGRPVFWSTPDRREEADTAKKALTAAVAASKSDHLAAVAAYNGWRAALTKGGRSAAGAFCTRHFVSEQAMEGIHAGRRQYAEILADLGFVPADYPAVAASASYHPGDINGNAASAAAERHCGPGGVDQFAGHARIVKAVLSAGFYPQLLRVEHPAAKYQKVQGGAMEIDGEAGKVRFFDREKGRVFLHPSSVNFKCGRFESGWLVYSDLVQTSKVFVREASMVPVYAVLLFGGEVSVHHGDSLVRVDSWATFKAPARIAVLVRELRAEVSALLEKKVMDPGLDLSSSRLVEAMHHLLSSDGF